MNLEFKKENPYEKKSSQLLKGIEAILSIGINVPVTMWEEYFKARKALYDGSNERVFPNSYKELMK